MIKEKFISLAAHDDSPFTPGGPDMQLPVFQPAGQSIFLAELIDFLLLSSKSHAHHRTAVTHPVTSHTGLFRGGELFFVFLPNTVGDFAVRKMEYFLIAFCTVEYHDCSAPFFMCFYFTKQYVP